MREANKSAEEKRAARRFGEFARSVRRNLRQADRIRERAEQAARLCHAKAEVAMLDAKASSGMTEEGGSAHGFPMRVLFVRVRMAYRYNRIVSPTIGIVRLRPPSSLAFASTICATPTRRTCSRAAFILRSPVNASDTARSGSRSTSIATCCPICRLTPLPLLTTPYAPP